jgi:hypothetical protein
MATAQQNGFDGRQMAQLIGLLDSPVDAEAAGALHRIRVLKKKHADVPFYELVERPDYKAAIWEKFGNPECLKTQMEAAALLEKLRQDNAQLEKDGAALAVAVKRHEETIHDLRAQLARRGGVSPQPMAQTPDTSGPVMTFLGGLVAFVGIVLMVVGIWHLAALGLEWIRSFF